MAKVGALATDAQRIRRLLAAKRAVQNAVLSQHAPFVNWFIGDGEVRGVTNRAIVAALRDALPAGQFKAAVVAKIDAQIATITAKYPGITFEE